ncbi:unnamed protein product [Miscanthus lutarioriparius]|uniref:BHLH domain-containing protein n=1 Tax=Miscanthus lutarioriparius TaxID=422564 RepID=A0A811MKK2_9POAL|nr:unnamed protein product [Miscanthus lutarioriparius]
MEDSSQFLQWALSTLQHDELPPATPAAAAAYDDNGCNTAFSSIPALGYSAASVSWSSANTDSGSGGGGGGTAWSPSSQQNSVNCATPRSSGSSGTNQQVSWNFNSASAQLIKEAQANSAAAAAAARAERGGAGGGVPVPQPQMVHNGPPPTRRASAKMSAASSSATCSHDHIVAERKRREKINQRFIELSAVIPCLKKMDKATILSDATRYVKELQEKLKALQQDCSGSGNAWGRHGVGGARQEAAHRGAGGRG